MSSLNRQSMAKVVLKKGMAFILGLTLLVVLAIALVVVVHDVWYVVDYYLEWRIDPETGVLVRGFVSYVWVMLVFAVIGILAAFGTGVFMVVRLMEWCTLSDQPPTCEDR